MHYFDVAALERHGHDPYLIDVLLGLDPDTPTGRRLRSAFPEFFKFDQRPQTTPWSFLRHRCNILEAYGHGEPTPATVRFFNLPLEEFNSYEVPAVWDVFQDGKDLHHYHGLTAATPRVLTLQPEEVEGAERRFYALEIIPCDDTPDNDGILVTAISLQYLDVTR
jgi:hypothetical protein